MCVCYRKPYIQQAWRNGRDFLSTLCNYKSAPGFLACNEDHATPVPSFDAAFNTASLTLLRLILQPVTNCLFSKPGKQVRIQDEHYALKPV